jgi:arylsulfatase A-like enzyme
MLFWGAGIKSGVHDEPVDTVDIAPTLASLIGLAVPSGDMDGRCLVSVLEAPSCQHR